MTTTTSRRIGSAYIWSAAALLLLLPAIAMRFTAEVNWSVADFGFFAVMLAAAAGGYELLSRRSNSFAYRAGAAVALLAGFFLIWVNLAVGIIGSEHNDANLLFAGVLAVAIGGSIVARTRAPGMAIAMFATAAAQVAVAAVALALRLGTGTANWPKDVLGVTALLTAMWLASAALFRRAR